MRRFRKPRAALTKSKVSGFPSASLTSPRASWANTTACAAPVALLHDHHRLGFLVTILLEHRLDNVQQLLETLPALIEGLLLEQKQGPPDEPLHRLLVHILKAALAANWIALVGQKPLVPTSQLQDSETHNQ